MLGVVVEAGLILRAEQLDEIEHGLVVPRIVDSVCGAARRFDVNAPETSNAQSLPVASVATKFNTMPSARLDVFADVGETTSLDQAAEVAWRPQSTAR